MKRCVILDPDECARLVYALVGREIVEMIDEIDDQLNVDTQDLWVMLDRISKMLEAT